MNYELKSDLFVNLGETKLICWSAGPTDPILSKNKKRILQNLVNWFFLIYYFLRFEKKKKKKKHNKLI